MPVHNLLLPEEPTQPLACRRVRCRATLLRTSPATAIIAWLFVVGGSLHCSAQETSNELYQYLTELPEPGKSQVPSWKLDLDHRAPTDPTAHHGAASESEFSVTPPPPPRSLQPFETDYTLSPISPVEREPPPLGVRYTNSTEVRRFEQQNFSLNLPGFPWFEGPPPSRDPTFRVALGRRNPDIIVLVASEPLGIELNLDASDAMKALQNQTRRTSPAATFSPPRPEANGGIQGLRYETRLIGEGGVPIYCATWLAVHRGFAYSIVALGPSANSDQIDAASRDICQRFQVLALNQTAHVDLEKVAKPFVSQRFGYYVDLSKLGWLDARQYASQFPGVEFAATRGTSSLTIFPLPLPGRAAELDMLGRVVMARANLVPLPGEAGATTSRLGTMPARQFVALHEEDDLSLTYVVRVAANENFGYILIGWAATEKKGDLQELQRAMDCVRDVPGFLPKNLRLSDEERTSFARVLNELGIAAHARGDFEAALDFCSGAHTLDARDEAILVNRLEVLCDLNRASEALKIAERELRNFPASENLRAIYAALLAKDGHPAEARRFYRALFLSGYTNEDALDAYLGLAADAEAHDEAIEVVTAVVERRPTPKMKALLAFLYGEKGDDATAIAQLLALRKENPASTEVAIFLAYAYEAAERHAEAIEVTQPLIDAGCRDETIWILHGRNQLHLEQYAAAKETLERAIEINPTSEPMRELLKAASNLLGQGDNSLLKKSIEPVEVPAVVCTEIERAAVRPAASLDMFGAEELVRITGISYRNGQPMRTSVSCRIKVHSARGVAQYSTLTFKLKPSVERLFVNRLAVLDATGKQVAEGNVDNYYVVDDNSSGLATNDKLVNIPVPALKPGHTIEYTVTREERFANEQFTFQEVPLSASVPVGVSAFYVEGDIRRLKHATSLSLDVKSTASVLYCVVANPAPQRSEPRQQSPDRYLPIVFVGDANASWDGVTRDYLESIAEKFQLDEPTRRLALELTKDCHSNREKLAVLAKHAQNACTYQGIEFGRRGRVPNSSGKTLELHYGDCKDHALLLKQLLAAVGIESHLAVVNSAGPVVEKLPSLDQFDHMVLCVRGDSVNEPVNSVGGLIIDATEKDADPLLSPPYGLADTTVLVLDAASPRLVRTPSYPTDALQMNVERRIAVRDLSNARHRVEAAVTEELTFNSYMAPAIRHYLRSFDPGKRREAIQELLSAGQHVRVQIAELEHLDSVSEPLVIRVEYTLPDSFQPLDSSSEGKLVVGRLPSAWEVFFLEADYLETRETPFEIKLPRLVRTSMEIELPEGYQLADIERWTNSGQTPFVAWASHASSTGERVSVNHVVRVPAGQYDATAYSAYYSDMKDSLSLLQLPVMFREKALETAARGGDNPNR